MNVAIRHTKQTQSAQGGRIAKEHADRALQPGAGRPEDRQGDPRRLPHRGRQEGPLRQESGEAINVADYTPRLRAQYRDTIRAALKEEFGYKNDMQIPRLDKIVLNMGVGEAVSDTKKVRAAAEDLAQIAGQKPVITKAKKSIAGFKVREEMPIGVKVTLRRDRMYEFLDRLVTVAMPRVRDFRGVNPKSFDGRGNYAMGLKEHIVFPEISFDKVEQVWGMDIVICTTAKTDAEAKALLKHFNMPFTA